MKKHIYLAVILAVILSSCTTEKEEPDPTPINFFSYKGETYLTPIVYYSPMFTAEGAQGGAYELFFPMSEITFEKVKRVSSFGTFYDSYPKGVGNAIKLRLISINKTNLPPGNYPYSYGSTTPEVFSFITVYTGYDFTRKSGTRDRPSQSNKGNGQVTIIKNGEISTINYQFTFDNGEKVIGSFKGVLNLDWYSTFNNLW